MKLNRFDCWDPSVQDLNNVMQLANHEKKIPRWMSMKKHYPYEIDIIERYVQMIFHRDYSAKCMLQIVGGRNTGKSTVGIVLSKIFEGVASFLDTLEIGDDWGMQGLMGFLVNIDLDARMGFYSKKTFGFLKKIVGDPGKPIKTKFIYAGFIEAVYSPFFFEFQNQFSTLPPLVDTGAWFKRNFCLVMDKKFEDNPQFEVDILAEASDIFTYIMLKPYNPIRKSIDFADENGKHGLENFIQRNQQIWEMWSDPLMKIFRNNFEYCEGVENVLYAEEVDEMFTDMIYDLNIRVSKPEEKVRELLKRKKIRFDSLKGLKSDGRVVSDIYTNIIQTPLGKIKRELHNPVIDSVMEDATVVEEKPNDFENWDMVKDTGGF